MQQPNSTILISIKPRFVEKILLKKKVLEFRRVWAAKPVEAIVIYASSPVRRIVAIAKVKAVHQGSRKALWELADEKGGGISREELYDYFSGKKTGYAVELGRIVKARQSVDPKLLFANFRPPQSFYYLDSGKLKKIVAAVIGR